jgi:hypothetical protein
MDAYGFRSGQLAHDVDIMNATVDNWDQRVDQVLMPKPGGTVALLVEVEPHHQRFAESPAVLDELDP